MRMKGWNLINLSYPERIWFYGVEKLQFLGYLVYVCSKQASTAAPTFEINGHGASV